MRAGFGDGTGACLCSWKMWVQRFPTVCPLNNLLFFSWETARKFNTTEDGISLERCCFFTHHSGLLYMFPILCATFAGATEHFRWFQAPGSGAFLTSSDGVPLFPKQKNRVWTSLSLAGIMRFPSLGG